MSTDVQEGPDDRRRLLEELDTTFVVEAAAGTGKTTVLVDRIVMLVRKGRARLQEIIAVTFTEKAAGEMKLRLRTSLERAREDQTTPVEERANLTQALEELEIARIGTIHGLCGDLLREYPVEARVDPRFEVAAEPETQAILSATFHREFQLLLEQQPPGIRRALRRRSRGPDAEPPRRMLLSAVAKLVERRDFDAPWHREPFDRDAAIDRAVPLVQRLAARAETVKSRKPDNKFVKVLELCRRFADEVRHRETVSPRDYDGLEGQLRELRRDGSLRYEVNIWGLVLPTGVTTEILAGELNEMLTELSDFVARADADLAALLHGELRGVVAAFEREKARAGVLDFVDLLLLTRNLLRDHASVRRSLQARFKRVFVDEFQDTDPLQSEVVLLLSGEDPNVGDPFAVRPRPGKLFLVGDPKQSIYRFRRADLSLYERVKRYLVSHGASLVYLSTSFRSTPGIQAAINGAFATAMTGEHQATYVALGESREGPRTQPSVIALPSPRPFSERGTVTKAAIESGIPDSVGALVDWLIRRSGWTVEEGRTRVPVQARHVCILFKRLSGFGGTDIPRPYAQALEARRIPHVLVGGRSFHQREEVVALRTALFAIDRPDDELSVYATLRGPFFAFTDEQLLGFKHAQGKLHPLRPFQPEERNDDTGPVIDALGLLGALHRERNRRPVPATIHELLERTRAHAGVALWTAGAQALANVLQLAELARRAEEQGTSFREVAESLQDDADAGEAPDAPLVEEGTEGVRMMTVHGAKGLEFPIVILAEPTANANYRDPSHFVDPERKLWVHELAGCLPHELRMREAEVRARDAEESIRLAYVAATRARDLLIVPVCGDKQFPDTWTEVLSPALFPLPGTEHQPREAPGCPTFGRDSVLGRESGVPPNVPLPGLHRAASRKNGVVWWDPRALELAREERTGLEVSDALLEDPVEGPKSIEAFEHWQRGRDGSIATGKKPREKVVVARELPPVLMTGTLPVEDTGVDRSSRPGGRRFGELVHACLAVVPLDASASTVAQTARLIGKALQAPEAEVKAAARAVEATLAHPLVTAARGSKDVRREVAIVDHLPDGTIVEGAIDLAYELDGRWQLVEFKTDDVLDDRRGAYEAQAQAYVRAIGAATGKPARGALLRV